MIYGEYAPTAVRTLK